jgi:hypothetical protein
MSASVVSRASYDSCSTVRGGGGEFDQPAESLPPSIFVSPDCISFYNSVAIAVHEDESCRARKYG